MPTKTLDLIDPGSDPKSDPVLGLCLSLGRVQGMGLTHTQDMNLGLGPGYC